jgi:glycosyltransferase involved in cell wall biosynthesis
VGSEGDALMGSVLHVDTRWRGVSGIGRFCTEVSSRLHPGWLELGGGSPSSSSDVFNPSRMRLTGADLVFSPGFNGGLSRARQLLTLHDLMHLRSERSALRALYYERVVRPIARRCGIVLTVSETSRVLIQDWLRDDSVDVVNVGNGLSLIGRPAAGIVPSTTDSAPAVLYVGNMKPHKSFPTVVATLSMMPRWRLEVVTTDPEQAAAQLRDYPALAGRTRIRSRISDQELAQAYRSASVVMMPSVEEGFGLPAIEALAAGGRLVYAADCTAIGEVVGDFGTSVTDRESLDEWRDAIERTSSQRAPADDQRFNALVARYSWDSVALKVQQVLDQLVVS